jgi:hypothetical protein
VARRAERRPSNHAWSLRMPITLFIRPNRSPLDHRVAYVPTF